MQTFSYYVQHYWLTGILLVGAALAVYLVYRKWDKIVIKDGAKK